MLLKYCFLIISALVLSCCAFSKNLISSSPTIGESIHGPIKIIAREGVSLHIRAENDIQTSETSYAVLPILSMDKNNDEKNLYENEKEKFVVSLALFAHETGKSLNFSKITLSLKDKEYKVTDVKKSRYANYPDSQALKMGANYVMCPKSQEVEDSLSKKIVKLENNGLWQCYELTFNVDTPSPREVFEITVTIKDIETNKNIAFDIIFEPYEWKSIDTFP